MSEEIVHHQGTSDGAFIGKQYGQVTVAYVKADGGKGYMNVNMRKGATESDKKKALSMAQRVYPQGTAINVKTNKYGIQYGSLEKLAESAPAATATKPMASGNASAEAGYGREFALKLLATWASVKELQTMYSNFGLFVQEVHNLGFAMIPLLSGSKETIGEFSYTIGELTPPVKKAAAPKAKKPAPEPEPEEDLPDDDIPFGDGPADEIF